LSKRPQFSTQPPFALQAEMQRGLAFHQQGRLADAERIYGEILQRVPNHFDVLHLLGMIACQNRNYERAVQLISKAISINPNVASAYYSRGIALKELKRLEEALVSCDKAIALKPDYVDAYSNRGIALKELKRLEEALVSYDRAIELKPDYAEAYYNRGIALKELKRLEEALVSYDKAIALKPNFAEAHFNRGIALAELKRPEEALVSYDKAIALSYDKAIARRLNYADVHYDRGIALQALMRPEEALVSYDKAIALKPNYTEAYSNRGIALHELKRPEEALVSYDKAIALQPNYAEAYYNRGIALQDLSRPEEALISYDKAIALKPNFADAYNTKGNVLKELGQLNEARAAIMKAIDIDPRSAGAYFNLADAKQFAPDDPHLAAMEKLLAKPEGLSKADRIKLDFALGKAYADLKDHHRSFHHLLAANAAQRATISYDETAALARFDRVETTFTRELIVAKSGGGDPSERPIFVLGMPRSGTTLIEQILASHPMVHGAGELKMFGEVVLTVRGPDGRTIPYPDFVPTLEASALRSIGQRYLASVHKRAPKGERVTDKMPSNYYFAGLIHLVLPNAKIIHTIRNPVDTCVSCFSKLFVAGQNHTYDLAELGRYYKRYEHLMEHWRCVLPPDQILDVQYEDVVADLEAQARRLLAYCQLPWDDRCLSFHETDRPVRTASVMQIRQPIYKSAVGRWRDYAQFLGPLLRALDAPSGRTE
jgi:tetratricopeptide (TPR) repeat protein